MRKLVLLLLAAAALLPVRCVMAQTPAELAEEKDAKLDELVNLEKETARAMQWNTGTFFRRVYGEDFEGILPTGQVMNKTAWIASVENTSTKFTSFVASDIRVRMFENTAVVTSLWSTRGTRNGREFARQSRVMHVYVYGQRGWLVIASQETLLPG
jgi:Domain of unknown function (DUF4440)